MTFYIDSAIGEKYSDQIEIIVLNDKRRIPVAIAFLIAAATAAIVGSIAESNNSVDQQEDSPVSAGVDED